MNMNTHINLGVLNYHIDRADRISSGNSIEHRLLDGSIEKTDLFLKKGPITVGITSGASTPDR
jgi:4-hydroxy-3-methylbut-2-enyl diphosphate reductase